jgi:hypothetical protein
MAHFVALPKKRSEDVRGHERRQSTREAPSRKTAELR